MTPEEFNLKIQTADQPLLVYFWAPWCVPCRGMSPMVQETAAQYSGKVELIKINADDSPELIRSLHIMAIPTLVGFANGKTLFRRIGAQDVKALNEIFSAVATEQPPAFKQKPIDRILRAGAGLTLILIGVSLPTGPNVLLLLAGGTIGFSAIYDRCPIYRAVSLRVKSLIRRIQGESTSGQ